MELLVTGLSHRTAPVEVRERVAVRELDQPQILAQLTSNGTISEAVVLSTCNRTEVYCAGRDGESVFKALDNFFVERQAGVVKPDEHLYRYQGAECVAHLFRVVSSLDSMVVGEAQILGQTKEAYDAAMRAKTAGGLLNPLFQKALSVAKRIRTETAIARNPVSVSSIAVDLAERILGHLPRRKVMILGSGKMAELVAKHLLDHGLRSVLVANRTFARAVALAERFNGKPIRFESMLDEIVDVDILIASTGAPHPLIRLEHAERIMHARRNRPIVLIDIAVPRDIDPEVNQIDNIFLYDIDDLQQAADENLDSRRSEMEAGQRIILEEARAFLEWQQSRAVGPAIRGLRQLFGDIVDAESRRLFNAMPELSDQQREEIRLYAERIMNKLLHPPVRQLKAAALDEDPQTFRQVCDLYGIDLDSSDNESGPHSADPENAQ